MLQPSIQAIISVIVIGSLTATQAAGPSIGIAMASGPFEINHSMVQGNASLFEGSEIRTSVASSKLRINGGARLEIGTDSLVKVYGTHTVLEKGAGQLEGGDAYRLEARTMQISGAAPKAIARVQLDGDNAVLVSALNGAVRVMNAKGIMLAKVPAGANLRFQQGGGAADAVDISGCLLKKSGKAIIVDMTVNQIFELQRADQSKDFGNRVTIKGKVVEGSSTVTGVTQIVAAENVTPLAPGGCLATAAAIGADPLEAPKPTPTATPVTTSGKPAKKPEAAATSGGTNKAVIAGVIIAGGAGAGIVVALASKSKSK